jgi:hypothetical protein
MNLDDVRVINGNDVKTYTIKTEVFIFDNEHQLERRANFEHCKIVCEPVVSVIGDAGNIIGCATLHKEGKSIYAELFIDYETPERLDLEIEGKRLYPHLHGHYVTSPSHGGAPKATSYHVYNLILNRNRDTDPRIGPI